MHQSFMIAFALRLAEKKKHINSLSRWHILFWLLGDFHHFFLFHCIFIPSLISYNSPRPDGNKYVHTNFFKVGWLVVFNVPSTARSLRDGSPIYCPLRRT